MRIWFGRKALVVTGAMAAAHLHQGDSAPVPILASDHWGVRAQVSLPH